MLAWIQLLTSILLAATVIYSYAAYRVSLGQLIESLSASMASISKTVALTAETVESEDSLINSSKNTLVETKIVMRNLLSATKNQTKQAAQRAEEVRAISSLVDNFGEIMHRFGDSLMVSVPTGLQWEGMKPMVVMSRPFEESATQIKTNAKDFRTIGGGILHISKTIAADGEQIGASFGKLGEQALMLLDETEKSFDRLQKQDLPAAILEMRTTSDPLPMISQQTTRMGDISHILMIFGLLLSAWCFMNSLSLLAMSSNFSTNENSK